MIVRFEVEHWMSAGQYIHIDHEQRALHSIVVRLNLVFKRYNVLDPYIEHHKFRRLPQKPSAKHTRFLQLIQLAVEFC